MRNIHLDNITQTRPTERTFCAAEPYFRDAFGSSSAPHKMGQELFPEIEASYKKIYTFFHAPEDAQFVFTSSGAEAISQVVRSSYKEMVQNSGKNHFLTRAIDEAPAILACSSLEEESALFSLVPASKHGFVEPDQLIDEITKRSCFFSTSIASALTGVIQPIEPLQKICKERGMLFHVDVTHAIGKIPLDFSTLDADYITFNGEQFQALKGTGGLFAKKEAFIDTLIHGENEERQKRGVSLNMPLFVSLAEAFSEAKEDEMLYATEVCRLRDQFEEAICERLDQATVIFSDEMRLPHISCIAFGSIKSEALSYLLQKKGVFASFGGGQYQHIEKVLAASGIEPRLCQSALSFSLTKETTESMLSDAVETIVETVQKAEKLSKVYSEKQTC